MLCLNIYQYVRQKKRRSDQPDHDFWKILARGVIFDHFWWLLINFDWFWSLLIYFDIFRSYFDVFMIIFDHFWLLFDYFWLLFDWFFAKMLCKKVGKRWVLCHISTNKNDRNMVKPPQNAENFNLRPLGISCCRTWDFDRKHSLL